MEVETKEQVVVEEPVMVETPAVVANNTEQEAEQPETSDTSNNNPESRPETEENGQAGNPEIRPQAEKIEVVKIMETTTGKEAQNNDDEEKKGTAEKPKPHPELTRDDPTQKSIRSGILRMHLESSSVIFGKVRSWKERYVHIDATDGIFICSSRDAFEKRDKKHMKVLPFSDIAGVLLKKPENQETATVSECRFVVYVKPRMQPIFGTQIELESPAGLGDAEEWVSVLKDKILVKARVYTVGLNGEFPENTRGVRPNVAICFSGGGGRAHVCAASQLRALHYLGLLKKDKIDYISGVSAGAWATCIYSFYQKGAQSDDELFGPLLATDLRKWTMDALQTTPLSPILKPALESCMKVASELVWTINSHELWERVMGKIFLKPFGLNKDVPYALKEDVEMIKRENPHLANTRFIIPRDPSRPFWIAHGTIIGPDWAKVGNLLPIQFTALYTGSPYLHKVHYQDKAANKRQAVVWVGGGMVDSFAFGGDEPTATERPLHKPSITPTLTAASSFGRFFSSSKRSTPKAKSPASSPRSNGSRSPRSAPSSPAAANHNEDNSNKLPKLASDAFADLVMQTTTTGKGELETIPKSRSGVPLYSGDIAEAISTLNLAPQMVQRVFRHAQDALKSQVFFNKSDGEQEIEHGQDFPDGVLEKQVQIPYPTIPFSLRHTLGISSDAPSVNLHEKTTFKRLNVQERYWTPVFVNSEANKEGKEDKTAPQATLGPEFNLTQNIATTHAVTMDMGDGGSLDNLGVCGMLQRGVRKLVVFCNTNNLLPPPHYSKKELRSSKLDFDANRRMSLTRLSSDPAAVMERERRPSSTSRRSSFRLSLTDKKLVEQALQEESPPTFDEWADDDILPLFGQSVDEKMLNYLGTHHSHNHVFPIKELRPLLRKMQDCLMKGEPIVVRSQHQVLDNPFWGIVGGWTVDILWVYLDDATQFRSSLPDDTMQELDKNKGEFARFPNFKTFGNNATFSFDISLTPRQVNLLSTFTEWQLMFHKDLLLDFVNEELPPLQRKRKSPETCLQQLEKEGFC